MAVVRQARSAPPYGLMIFVFLWVVSTGAAIFFYLQADRIERTNAAALDEYRKLASTEDMSNSAVHAWVQAGGKAQPRRTGIRQAVAEFNQLKNLLDVGGSGRDVNELNTKYVQARREAAVKNGVEDSNAPVSAIEMLDYLKRRAELAETGLAKADDQLADVQKVVEAYKASLTKDLDSAKKSAADRQTEIADINAKLQDLQAKYTADVKKSEEDKTALQQKHEADIRALVAQLQQAKDDLDKRDGVIKELQKRLAILGATPQAGLLAEADGRVIRADQVSGEVYIGLGKKDRVTPGLTFAVYDPKLGMRSGTDGGGKAKLEVVEVGDTESLCRITFTEKGQHVETNDLIGNIVYHKDRTRTYHFVVYGDFDLIGDGVPTGAQREKVVRMIQSWGGVVDDNLTTQTDFLVMGAMPGSAANKLASDSAQASDVAQQRKAAQDKYNAMLKDARDLSIPLLNANRFLAMIGYYNTTIVRY